MSTYLKQMVFSVNLCEQQAYLSLAGMTSPKADRAQKVSMYYLDIYKMVTVKPGAKMVSREKQATAECWGHRGKRPGAGTLWGKSPKEKPDRSCWGTHRSP